MDRNYVGLDISTKTGIVRLDAEGELWEAQEVDTGLDGRSPTSIAMKLQADAVVSYVEPGDLVAIESFGFASQSGFFLGGIGWLIRVMLDIKGVKYFEVSPSQLKKFTGAGGTAAKEMVAVEVYKRWGEQFRSNNVTDAYVLAQIARAMEEPVRLIKCQDEVIQKLRGK